MRLTYATQAEAQAVADRIFKDMAGELEPGTTAWAVPYQDRDAKGNVISADWHVAIDERCRGVLTKTEEALFPEWNTKVVP